MTFADDVTKDMIGNMIDKILFDLEEHQKNAEAEYQRDKNNDFQYSMATAFKCAGDMIRSRIEVLTE